MPPTEHSDLQVPSIRNKRPNEKGGRAKAIGGGGGGGKNGGIRGNLRELDVMCEEKIIIGVINWFGKLTQLKSSR